jgi:hypothetical protein
LVEQDFVERGSCNRLRRMTSPRSAHYQLAHVAIRSVAFKNPYDFMSLMASAKALEVLASLLDQVHEQCADEELLELDELAIHRTRVLGSPCLIVEMPPAEVPPEAHFVGVWLTANDGPETGQVRYFTLEAADPQRPARTMLSEWTGAGDHVSHGAGPEPSLEGFIEAITALVARYH